MEKVRSTFTCSGTMTFQNVAFIVMHMPLLFKSSMLNVALWSIPSFFSNIINFLHTILVSFLTSFGYSFRTHLISLILVWHYD